MLIKPQGLPEVLEIVPEKFGDTRGFFSETYSARKLAEAGVETTFVQDNHSYSAERGVLRGLHYQLPPFAQAKLVRVIKGSIFDVSVDIRQGSPRYGQWCGCTLTSQDWNQVLVPAGFAHGFLTLEADTEVLYKVSDFYAPEHERAIHFADPDLTIEWPLAGIEPVLSEKDRLAPQLKDQSSVFKFSG